MGRLDDLNRTERYFTSTLLGGLLLHNKLEGTREFLNWLGRNKALRLIPTGGHGDNISWQESYILPEHIEVTTELNIKREIGHYGETLEGLDLADLSQKQNVPDVVIVYGEVLIVIEGKFFVKGQGSAMIDSQLNLQKEEMTIMVDYLNPEIRYTCHIFLGPDDSLDLSNCDLSITWKDIEEFSTKLLGNKHYITERLRNANKRYAKYNTPSTGDRLNYNAKCSFMQIIELCREEGDNIRVGFHGGERVLIQTGYQSLLNRKFKWDYTENSIGKKNLKNWLPGNLFLLRIEELSKNKQSPTLNEPIIPKQISKNYHDKTNLNGILSLCAKHGDNLLIGFSGGLNAMINTPKSKLDTRMYKYDFVENSTGKKTNSNWINGNEFMRLLREYFS